MPGLIQSQAGNRCYHRQRYCGADWQEQAGPPGEMDGRQECTAECRWNPMRTCVGEIGLKSDRHNSPIFGADEPEPSDEPTKPLGGGASEEKTWGNAEGYEATLQTEAAGAVFDGYQGGDAV
eukprot:gnl/TRDRNA2_/TRDRNA2_97715_c0_seq1.p2 gnl/TRDRNA2_/TRDRNA2_97715_c0~~gnl/TRDRNA2_/TRDRNA2_97715_c0_seq1.p2  ORF type:complete len:122 (-),score=18.49 gnl/TRDRNA2_/TRDRNA2_97715_c0_seq1:222-587(-)